MASCPDLNILLNVEKHPLNPVCKRCLSYLPYPLKPPILCSFITQPQYDANCVPTMCNTVRKPSSLSCPVLRAGVSKLGMKYSDESMRNHSWTSVPNSSEIRSPVSLFVDVHWKTGKQRAVLGKERRILTGN